MKKILVCIIALMLLLVNTGCVKQGNAVDETFDNNVEVSLEEENSTEEVE